eukprot:436684_1
MTTILLTRRCNLYPKLFRTTSTHFSTKTEQWKGINGCSNYQVSDQGNVINKKLNRKFWTNIERFKKMNRSVQIILITDDKRTKPWYLNRLILEHFKPQENMDKMYACHLDGNSYNNVLSNLEWNKSPTSHRIHGSHAATAIIAKHQDHGMLQFQSQKECQQYLNSVNIAISSSYLNNCIRNGKQYQGYSFTYCNEDLYATTVIDLPNEQWKECHRSTRSLYLVSNVGRIKCIAKNGKERLIKLSNIGGYQMFKVIGTCKNRTVNLRVHRMVGTFFVPNPNNYTTLDHIDTNCLNNVASNLRWVKDAKVNANNVKTKLKRSESLQNKQSIKQIDKSTGCVIKIWERAWQTTEQLGCYTCNIFKVCRGERRSAYGFIWQFVEE